MRIEVDIKMPIVLKITKLKIKYEERIVHKRGNARLFDLS